MSTQLVHGTAVHVPSSSPQAYKARAGRSEKSHIELGLRREGGVTPGAAKGFVQIVGRIEVEAQSGEVGAQGQHRQVRVSHADDIQKTQKPKAVQETATAAVTVSCGCLVSSTAQLHAVFLHHTRYEVTMLGTHAVKQR